MCSIEKRQLDKQHGKAKGHHPACAIRMCEVGKLELDEARISWVVVKDESISNRTLQLSQSCIIHSSCMGVCYVVWEMVRSRWWSRCNGYNGQAGTKAVAGAKRRLPCTMRYIARRTGPQHDICCGDEQTSGVTALVGACAGGTTSAVGAVTPERMPPERCE